MTGLGKIHIKNYFLIVIVCGVISLLAFFIRPHDCKTTYGPPPYYYNTDLTLWVHLAERPIENLSTSILANRPLFAYMAWSFAQPAKLVVGEMTIASPTRDSGKVTRNLATLAGLFLANIFSFMLTGVLLYHFTETLFNDTNIALLASLLWVTSSFAFAWSYHPVNQMAGLIIIFGFPLFLFRLTAHSGMLENLLFGLGFGILLLMKAYYVLPFVYIIWASLYRFKPVVIVVTFCVFFIPTLLWRQVYELLTGLPFIDYHLGAGGITGTVATYFTFEGIRIFINTLIAGIVEFPRVIFNSSGLIITISALGFFFDAQNQKKYAKFFLFSIIFVLLFFAFLKMAGVFIPRHGSDFFPILYPASAFFIFTTLKDQKKHIVYVCIAIWILLTLISYSQPWLCATAFL